MPGMTVTEAHIKQTKLYLANYEEYGIMPSVLKLAITLGVNRKTLTNVKSNPPKTKDHSLQAKLKRRMIILLELVHDMQHDVLLEGGLDGSLNSNIVKLALGKHGYSEKKEQQITGKDEGPVIIDNHWTIHVVKAGKK